MINRFKWLEVKPETRKNVIAFLSAVDGFEPIKRSGVVEVAGNKVVCDGFTDHDLCAITPELLKAALGEHTLTEIDKTDVYALFNELVRRLEMPVVVMPEIIKPDVETISTDKVDKITKVKKTNKK
jgi:hypothetical protein